MRIRSSKNSSPPNYCINGIPISTSTTTRDLGVLIDSQLSYNDHITQITSKASQRVGALFRGFLCRDLQFLRRVYITYIRPMLEYCSVIWNPTLKKHIDQIEDVQRRFTKRIPSISNLSYILSAQLVSTWNRLNSAGYILTCSITIEFSITLHLMTHLTFSVSTIHQLPSAIAPQLWLNQQVEIEHLCLLSVLEQQTAVIFYLLRSKNVILIQNLKLQ